METALDFAKKHGLESYLERPAELNELIFKLLVLQETMQQEEVRKISAQRDLKPITVKRSVAGAFTAQCCGEGAYRYAVETALLGSTATVPVFQRGRFINMLKNMGVPEKLISQYADTVVIDDRTHCFDPD